MVFMLRGIVAGIFATLLCAATARAVAPGDVIINEVYFNLLDSKQKNHFEAVELLVVKGGLDLNGLQISDRDVWSRATEDQCTLQDMGQGFLSKVPAGTLIVIYNGTGTDDSDPKDSVLRFYAQSSLYCNVAPTAHAFHLADAGDNLHLLHDGRQIDFLKYRPRNQTLKLADPGQLNWEGGVNGVIDVGDENENVGFRFLGDKPELNDFPAAWRAHNEVYLQSNNLGLPNGGRNSEWIDRLRVPGSPGSPAKTTVP